MKFTQPTPDQIRRTRKGANLTQEHAGRLCCTTGRSFRRWEAGDQPMHPGLWKLFCIQTGNKVCT